MANFFRSLLSPPNFPGDEEKSRKAALLQSILLIAMAATIFYTLSTLFTHEKPAAYLAVGTGVCIFWLVGMWLIRRGHIGAATNGFTLATWFFLTIIAWFGNGYENPIVTAFFLLITFAGLAISSQVSLLVAILSVLTVIGLALAGAWQILPPAFFPSTGGSSIVMLTIGFLGMSGILFLVNQGIQKVQAQQEQTARELRERSATLSALLEAIPDTIFRISPEGIWLDYIPSSSFETLLPPEEFLGRSLEATLPAELAATTRRYLEMTLSTGQTQTYEYSLSQGYYEARMALDQGNNVVALVRNVTVRVQSRVEREQLMAALERGNAQLRTAAEVSKTCSGIFNPDALVEKAVNLIQQGLAVYYAGLFLVDPKTQLAVLRGGSGNQGREMLAAGHSLPLDGQSMVSWCIRNNQARIAQQTTRDTVWLQNPYLPETRSELALPLVSRDQVIGALTVQSAMENAFTENDIAILQAMAEQLAISVDNANLFTELQYELAERKKAEVALRSSEERFQKIFRSSPVIITIRDLDGHYISVNDTFTKDLGYTFDEIAGKTVDEMGYIVSQKEWGQAQENLARNGSFADLVVEVRRKDGEHVFRLMNSEITTLDGEPRVLTTSMDITERKKSEEALKASEEKFSKAFHALSSAAFIQRARDHQYLEVNEAFCSLTGYDREEVLNSTVMKLSIFPGPGIMEIVEKSLLGSGRLQSHEFTFMKKGGKTGTGLLSVDQITVNREPCYLVLIQDITQQKLAALERDRLIQELSAKNAELERFTYTVSHDLKSPLVTIRGFTGYLEQDMQSGDIERLKSDVKRISGAAEKMQRLLDELLELSRIGRLVNPPEEIPFEEIAREAASLVEGQLKKGRVNLQIAGDLPIVYGDRVRLVEVVQNLLDNAIKFMGEQPQPLIEIGAISLPGQGPIFFVKDNGIGIPPAYQERVFRLFDKLDPASEGTGVGLALVKRIVEVHGGKVWLESEGTGKGTTFLFTLPRREAGQ